MLTYLDNTGSVNNNRYYNYVHLKIVYVLVTVLFSNVFLGKKKKSPICSLLDIRTDTIRGSSLPVTFFVDIIKFILYI